MFIQCFRFSITVTQSSFHSLTLSSVMSLQQIKTDLEVQTWNLCCVDIWLVVISIDFLLLVLNTRVVSMSHIPIELISFSRFLMHVSFPF